MPHSDPVDARPPVARRTVLSAIGASAAALAAAPALAGAASAAPTTPATGRAGAAGATTLAVPATRSASAAGAAATRVRAGFPLGYAAVGWDGPQRGAAIRFLDANGRPGDWQALRAGCTGGPDGPGGAAAPAPVTALVPADGAHGYDLRLPHGAQEVRSTAIDTVAGPTQRVTLAGGMTRTFYGIPYYSRAAWGADESKRFKNGVENSPAKYYPLQSLTVHHTDTPNGDADPAATIRAIYEYHAVTLDWGDIGYHFLIDEQGRLYEGRWSGDDSRPAFDAAGNLVTAFHTSGFNSGNLGIALIGNLAGQAPTTAARRTLKLLLATQCRSAHLDPKARITYTNPVNGVTKPVDMISGHRDWLVTDCPGGTMYADLPALRNEVATLVNPAG